MTEAVHDVLEKLLAVAMVQFLKDCLVCVQNKNHWTKSWGGGVDTTDQSERLYTE